MIGQKNFAKRIDDMISANKFPRFVILVGLPGSGKKMWAHNIAVQLDACYVEYSPGVDEMRTMIGHANKVATRTVFTIADADNMSPAAKNCILKVVEEPPQEAHFIMTVTDINNVLETIRSRATVLYMDKYSADEIGQFIDVPVSSTIRSVICNVCETPGDVKKIFEYDPAEFIEYVNKVADNFDRVSIANMYKIGNKVKLKDTQDGYDMRLFFRMFIEVCIDRLRSDVLRYGNYVRLTNKKLQDLQITGVNKQALFDEWITDIKGVEHQWTFQSSNNT